MTTKNERREFRTYTGGSIILFLRVRDGMNQTELAKATGISANEMSRMERGFPGASIRMFDRLANFFAVEAETLIRNDFRALRDLRKPSADTKKNALRKIRERRMRCDRIGVEGENWVVKEEHKKLAGTPWCGLVNGSFADDELAHFDVLSFDEGTGEQILIEVKATNGGPGTRFYLSAAERQMMEYCLSNGIRYELHRVYYVEKPKLRYRDIFPAELLVSDAFAYEPYGYAVRRVS